MIAPTYHYSQALHLRHFLRFLAGRADAPCGEVAHRDLDRYLKARLAVRHANTAEGERVTLLQFYKWSVRQGLRAGLPSGGPRPHQGG
jgi:site-specific recombinase XerD